MAQSGTIGFALVLGFIVYITVKGELPAYLCVVGFGTGCPAPGSGQTASNPSSQNQTTTNSTILSPPNNTGYTTTINTSPSQGNACDAFGDTDAGICAIVNGGGIIGGNTYNGDTAVNSSITYDD
jgi:hypothetical protein